MELSKVTSEITAAIEYGGEVLNVVFDGAKVTGDRIFAIQESENEDAMYSFLVEITKSWDLTSGGTPLPIDEPTMRMLPLPLVGKMFSVASDRLDEGE